MNRRNPKRAATSLFVIANEDFQLRDSLKEMKKKK
jgi:hypothetical protein